MFFAFPTYPAYDSLYSLLWAQELLDGAALPASTPTARRRSTRCCCRSASSWRRSATSGARVFVALCLAGLVALDRRGLPARAARRRSAGRPRRGRPAAHPLQLRAAGLEGLPRRPVLRARRVGDGARGRAPAPRRRRSGGCSAWPGCCAPRRGCSPGSTGSGSAAAGSAPRIRALAPAAAAPRCGSPLDLAVTGDPLFSIHHTDALAAELQRDIPLRSAAAHDDVAARRDREARRCSLLAAGRRGARDARRAGARWRSPPRSRSSPCATYLVIASGGLATVYRYLLLTGIGALLLAAYALTGWTRLDAGSRAARAPWIAAALLAVVAGGGYTVTHLSLAAMRRRSCASATAIRTELVDAAARPGGRRRAALRADHRPQPQAAARDPLGARTARGRGARALGPHARRDRAAASRSSSRRPLREAPRALRLRGPRRRHARSRRAPRRATRVLAASRRFEAWGRC